MENILLVVTWALVMFLVSTISFIVIYRKLSISTNERISKLEKAETELLDELKKVDILEFEQTESGKQLLNLLQQETPHLIDKVTLNQSSIRKAIVEPYKSEAVIQNIINDVRQLERQNTSNKSVSQKSTLSVSLDGASDAIRLVKEMVVPWRRQHAENMARLSEQEKLIEIEFKRAEILAKRVQVAKEQEGITKLQAEAEKLKLEDEKLRLELQRAKVQLAIDILSQISPNLSEIDRIAYAAKLMPSLDTLILSELEIFNK